MADSDPISVGEVTQRLFPGVEMGAVRTKNQVGHGSGSDTLVYQLGSGPRSAPSMNKVTCPGR